MLVRTIVKILIILDIACAFTGLMSLCSKSGTFISVGFPLNIQLLIAAAVILCAIVVLLCMTKIIQLRASAEQDDSEQ